MVFKNKEKQCLLEELLFLCNSMYLHGLKEDSEEIVGASNLFRLHYSIESSKNNVFFSLFKKDGHVLNSTELRVYDNCGIPYVSMWYRNLQSQLVEVNEPLSDIENYLMGYVNSLSNLNRVSALLYALQYNLRGAVYFVNT